MGDGWGSWDSCARPPPNNGRPPTHRGYSQAAVPSWERNFCTSVCFVPWGRICAAKATLSAYRNIAEWEDAAALEAFQNAKARYWADINGLPCKIPLPDPDMYIHKVDHNAIIDQALVEDLEKHPPPCLPNRKNDISNGWNSVITEDKPITATGWGIAEDGSTVNHTTANWDKLAEQPNVTPRWGDSENNLPGNGDTSKIWNCSGSWQDITVRDDYWGVGTVDNNWNNGRSASVQHVQKNNSWRNARDPSGSQCWNNLNNEQDGRENKKRNRGHYDSRYSESRQLYNHEANRSDWNDCRDRNLADYRSDKTMRGGQPMFMRQSKSRWPSGPVDPQRSAESSRTQHWDRSRT